MNDPHMHYEHARLEYKELFSILSHAYQHPEFDGVDRIARDTHERLSFLENIFPELGIEFS